MTFKESVILLVVYALYTTNGYSQSVLHETNSLELQQLLARSTGNECYNNYLEVTQLFARRAQAEHNACVEISKNETLKAEAAYFPVSNYLAKNYDDSCNAFIRCSQLRPAKEALKCLVVESSKNAIAMRELSINASNNLIDLVGRKQLIKHQEYKCANSTEDKLYQSVSLAYIDLINCIKGKTNVRISSESQYKLSEETASTAKPEILESFTETSARVDLAMKPYPIKKPEDIERPPKIASPSSIITEVEPTKEHDLIINTEGSENLQPINSVNESKTTENSLTSKKLKDPQSTEIPAEASSAVEIIKKPETRESYHTSESSTGKNFPTKIPETSESLVRTESPSEDSTVVDMNKKLDRIKNSKIIHKPPSTEGPLKLPVPSESLQITASATEHPTNIEGAEKHLLNKISESTEIFQHTESPTDIIEKPETSTVKSETPETSQTTESPTETPGVTEFIKNPDHIQKSESPGSLQVSELPNEDLAEVETTEKLIPNKEAKKLETNESQTEIIEKLDPIKKAEDHEGFRTSENSRENTADVKPIRKPDVIKQSKASESHQTTERPNEVFTVVAVVEKTEALERLQTDQTPTEKTLPRVSPELHKSSNETPSEFKMTESLDPNEKLHIIENPQPKENLTEATKKPDLIQIAEVSESNVTHSPTENETEIETTEKLDTSRNDFPESQKTTNTSAQTTESPQSTYNPPEASTILITTTKPVFMKKNEDSEELQTIESPTEHDSDAESVQTTKNPAGAFTAADIIEKPIPIITLEAPERLQMTEISNETIAKDDTSKKPDLIKIDEVSNSLQDTEYISETPVVIDATKRQDHIHMPIGTEILKSTQSPRKETTELCLSSEKLDPDSLQTTASPTEASTVVEITEKTASIKKTAGPDTPHPTEITSKVETTGKLLPAKKQRPEITETPSETETTKEPLSNKKSEDPNTSQVGESPTETNIVVTLTENLDPLKKPQGHNDLQNREISSPAEADLIKNLKLIERLQPTENLTKIYDDFKSSIEIETTEKSIEQLQTTNSPNKIPAVVELTQKPITIKNNEPVEGPEATESPTKVSTKFEIIEKSEVSESLRTTENPTAATTTKPRTSNKPRAFDSSQNTDFPQSTKTPTEAFTTTAKPQFIREDIDSEVPQTTGIKTETHIDSEITRKLLATKNAEDSEKHYRAENSGEIPAIVKSNEKPDLMKLHQAPEALQTTQSPTGTPAATKKPDQVKIPAGAGILETTKSPTETSTENLLRSRKTLGPESLQTTETPIESSTLVEITEKTTPIEITELPEIKSTTESELIKNPEGPENLQITESPTENETTDSQNAIPTIITEKPVAIGKYEASGTPQTTESLTEIENGEIHLFSEKHKDSMGTQTSESRTETAAVIDPDKIPDFIKIPEVHERFMTIERTTKNPAVVEFTKESKLPVNLQTMKKPALVEFESTEKPPFKKKPEVLQTPEATKIELESTNESVNSENPKQLETNRTSISLTGDSTEVENTAKSLLTNKAEISEYSTETPITKPLPNNRSEAYESVQITENSARVFTVADSTAKPGSMIRLRTTETPNITIAEADATKKPDLIKIHEVSNAAVIGTIKRQDHISKPIATEFLETTKSPSEETTDFFLSSEKSQGPDSLQTTEGPTEASTVVEITERTASNKKSAASPHPTEITSKVETTGKLLLTKKQRPEIIETSSLAETTKKPLPNKKSEDPNTPQVGESTTETNVVVTLTENLDPLKKSQGHNYLQNREISSPAEADLIKNLKVIERLQPTENLIKIYDDFKSSIEIETTEKSTEQLQTTNSPNKIPVVVELTQKPITIKNNEPVEGPEATESPTKVSTIFENIEKTEASESLRTTENPTAPTTTKPRTSNKPRAFDSSQNTDFPQSTKTPTEAFTTTAKPQFIREDIDSEVQQTTEIKTETHSDSEISKKLLATKNAEDSEKHYRAGNSGEIPATVESNKEPDLMKQHKAPEALQTTQSPTGTPAASKKPDQVKIPAGAEILETTKIPTDTSTENILRSRKTIGPESLQTTENPIESSALVEITEKTTAIEITELPEIRRTTESPNQTVAEIKSTKESELIKNPEGPEILQITESPTENETTDSQNAIPTIITEKPVADGKYEAFDTPQTTESLTEVKNGEIPLFSEKHKDSMGTQTSESRTETAAVIDPDKIPDFIKIPEVHERFVTIERTTKNPAVVEFTMNLDSSKEPKLPVNLQTMKKPALVKFESTEKPPLRKKPEVLQMSEATKMELESTNVSVNSENPKQLETNRTSISLTGDSTEVEYTAKSPLTNKAEISEYSTETPITKPLPNNKSEAHENVQITENPARVFTVADITVKPGSIIRLRTTETTNISIAEADATKNPDLIKIHEVSNVALIGTTKRQDHISIPIATEFLETTKSLSEETTDFFLSSEKSQGVDSLQTTEGPTEASTVVEITEGTASNKKSAASPHPTEITSKVETTGKVLLTKKQGPEITETSSIAETTKKILPNKKSEDPNTPQVGESRTETNIVFTLTEKLDPLKQSQGHNNLQNREISSPAEADLIKKLKVIERPQHTESPTDYLENLLKISDVSESPIEIETTEKTDPMKKPEIAEGLQTLYNSTETSAVAELPQKPVTIKNAEASKGPAAIESKSKVFRIFEFIEKLDASKSLRTTENPTAATITKPRSSKNPKAFDSYHDTEIPQYLKYPTILATTEKPLLIKRDGNSEEFQTTEIPTESYSDVEMAKKLLATKKAEDPEKLLRAESSNETPTVLVESNKNPYLIKLLKAPEDLQTIKTPTEIDTTKRPDTTKGPDQIKVPEDTETQRTTKRPIENLNFVSNTENVKPSKNPEIFERHQTTESSTKTPAVVKLTQTPLLSKQSEAQERPQASENPIETPVIAKSNPERHQVTESLTETLSEQPLPYKQPDGMINSQTSDPTDIAEKPNPITNPKILERPRTSETVSETTAKVDLSKEPDLIKILDFFQTTEYLTETPVSAKSNPERHQVTDSLTETLSEQPWPYKQPDGMINSQTSDPTDIAEKPNPITNPKILERPRTSETVSETTAKVDLSKEPDLIKILDFFQTTEYLTETPVSVDPTKRKYHIKINKVPEIFQNTESSTDNPDENYKLNKNIQGPEFLHTESSAAFEIIDKTGGAGTNERLNELTTEVELTKKPDILKNSERLDRHQIAESLTEVETTEKSLPRIKQEAAEGPIKVPIVFKFTEKPDLIVKHEASHRPHTTEIKFSYKINGIPLPMKKDVNYEGLQTTESLTKAFAEVENPEDLKWPQTNENSTDTSAVLQYTENFGSLEITKSPLPDEVESTEKLQLGKNSESLKTTQNTESESSPQLESANESGCSKNLKQIETPQTSKGLTEASTGIEIFVEAQPNEKSEVPKGPQSSESRTDVSAIGDSVEESGISRIFGTLEIIESRSSSPIQVKYSNEPKAIVGDHAYEIITTGSVENDPFERQLVKENSELSDQRSDKVETIEEYGANNISSKIEDMLRLYTENYDNLTAEYSPPHVEILSVDFNITRQPLQKIHIF